MKSSNFFFGGIVIVVSLIMVYSFSGQQATDAYAEEMATYRKEKDELFAEGKASPLDRKQKKEFTGLKYFPVDESFRIIADFEAFPLPERMNINTTQGESVIYNKYGKATFFLNNQQHELLILRSTDRLTANILFIPFTDETSGRGTYGAGRYLDAEMSGNNKIILDFNSAYNPYCAYNSTYECPLPPIENNLSVKIEAGEKTFKEADLN